CGVELGCRKIACQNGPDEFLGLGDIFAAVGIALDLEMEAAALGHPFREFCAGADIKRRDNAVELNAFPDRDLVNVAGHQADLDTIEDAADDETVLAAPAAAPNAFGPP